MAIKSILRRAESPDKKKTSSVTFVDKEQNVYKEFYSDDDRACILVDKLTPSDYEEIRHLRTRMLNHEFISEDDTGNGNRRVMMLKRTLQSAWRRRDIELAKQLDYVEKKMPRNELLNFVTVNAWLLQSSIFL